MECIGIDLGTSNIRGVLYNIEKQEVVSQLLRYSNADIKSANTWEYQQDPHVIVDIAMKILSQLIRQGTDIIGIGITGQMHGIVYIDENGDAVSPLYTWQDKRTLLIYKNKKDYITYLSELINDSTHPQSCTFKSGYGLSTHFFNKENSLVPDSAVRFATIADYFAMKLIGANVPKTSPCNKASLGICPNADETTIAEQMELLDINPEFLPEFTPYYTLLGETCYEGIQPGIPVAVPIGDNQAGTYGTVEDYENSMHINAGSSGQISVVVRDTNYQIFKSNVTYPPEIELRPFPTGVMLVGSLLSFGYTYTCLVRFFSDIVLTLCGLRTPFIEELNSIDPSIHNKFDDPPPVFTTTFLGTRQNPHQTASISNLTPSNFNMKSLMHATYNGMIDELYSYYQILVNLGFGKEQLIITGDGVKKNKYLQKIIKERFNLPIQIAESGGTAIGAVLYVHDILSKKYQFM